MGKKLNEIEIELAISKNPNTQFDICSICDGAEEGMVMNELNSKDFDVICDECEIIKNNCK